MLVEQVEIIKSVFPKFPANLIKVLKNRFIDNGFCDSRLIDAVNHVIDNYAGWDKLPSIADFINYDKKMRIFTYLEACSFGISYLKSVDIGANTLRWVLEEDAKQYKMKEWVPPGNGTKPIPKAKAGPNLTEEEKAKNIGVGEMKKMFKEESIKKVERKIFTRQEKSERLEKFNEEHGIK